MAARRGPSYAVTTPILTPSVEGITVPFVQSFSSIDDSIIQLSTSMLNSLTSFSSGGVTTTGGYGATGGYYYKLLTDLLSGLF
jgi:hypothetical protein